MKTVEISYNPYKMITHVLINKVDVCQNEYYKKFKEFIEHKIPLQTWIEPIPYLDWGGFVNEVSDPEINDEVTINFSGRVIDFADLKRSIDAQNDKRGKARVIYHYKHKKVLDDKILAKNIEDVVTEIKSERFNELVKQRTTNGLKEKYLALDENYTIAKESEFFIVLTGVYSAGKSTLLNTLIRHDILPTSAGTCTSKNCRIRHDASLGKKVSLCCYDDKNNIVIEKRLFDTDAECAEAFENISPMKKKGVEEKYPNVFTMELGVDLSHLYPESVSDETFTIVLIDTPGVDSAESSEYGHNKHAETALDAITMDSKPVIILCVDANKYQDDSIGEFMKQILAESKQDDSGFNDRFLFLMNKSDACSYKMGETPDAARAKFAEYLTSPSQWRIDADENDLKALAESASHFVPRIFMTAARVALAIQCKAYDFSDEELEDSDKEDLQEKFEGLRKKVCERKRTNYYLSNYCDVPEYRKEEIRTQFEAAIKDGDDVRATQLQCGLVSVELAIRDYIERYAYPIKVRGLLSTFEDILGDVKDFTSSFGSELKKLEEELGEKKSEREEVEDQKKCVQEKIDALDKAKRSIDEQLCALDSIRFDSASIEKAITDFQVDIENDEVIFFIRSNPVVQTGQKSHDEVSTEIDNYVSHIKEVFDKALEKTNSVLESIKTRHDKQILEIFECLRRIVHGLEESTVLRQGEYSFTSSVTWKSNFANIDSDSFAEELKKKVVDRTIEIKDIPNYKKKEWQASWNPFKKIGSVFLKKTETIVKSVDGYYSTSDICKSINDYYIKLASESSAMKVKFEKMTEESKAVVKELAGKLKQELTQFNADVEVQKKRLSVLGASVEKLDEEKTKTDKTLAWLTELQHKIEEE